MLSDATQIADPFHLIKLANSKLDECRRPVQNETMGHRGRKTDPLYRCRRLLTRADERLDDRGRTKLLGLLDAGDPHGEVRAAWHAREVVRSIYGHHDPDLAIAFVERLGRDLQDESCPVEVCSLGRTLVRWKNQIAAWHSAHVTNEGTEAANNLSKRVKRWRSDSPAGGTSGFESCSTPAAPTGTYWQLSHPAEIRRADYGGSPTVPARRPSSSPAELLGGKRAQLAGVLAATFDGDEDTVSISIDDVANSFRRAPKCATGRFRSSRASAAAGRERGSPRW
jgi:hypothetical protein